MLSTGVEIAPPSATALNADNTLRRYGLVPVAKVRLEEGRFVIATADPETCALEKCVYAFVVADEMVRIGSSKGVLGGRFAAWQRDVSKALAGLKSSTREKEAATWRALLTEHGEGVVYARQGTTVKTPVGTFSTYLDEESLLIGLHRPRLNWSFHR